MTPDRLLDHFDRMSDAPDAIPRLRRFILDLALRGKLAEQDPNDEPASELLTRIHSEKARLVKEGKIRGQNHQPEIELEETPFALPNRWAWARLGDVIHLVSGQHLQPGEYSDQKQSGPPYITGPADFGENGLVITRYATVRKALATANQILLTVKGAGIGKTAICDLPEVAISRQLMAMTAIEWSQRYLLLTAHRLATVLKDSARSLIPGISRENVDQFVVGLPPLAEQHRIVAKVDQLMALCDRLETAQAERESRRAKLAAASLHRLNNGADADEFREHARFHLRHLPRLTTRLEHIQQLRQTILNLAVRGKLVSQDPNDEPASELLKRIQAWRSAAIAEGKIRTPRKHISAVEDSEAPYELPRLWDWARLGQIIYIHSGDGLTAEAMRHGSVPVFGGNGITGFHDAPNVLRPTVVIGRVGYYCGSIHVTPSQAWITDNAFITEFCTVAIFQKFLVILLKATNLKENEKATAQPVISGAKIYPIIVGLPPLTEQHRIVAKVEELMALCEQLETQLTTTQTERRRLLEAVLHEALDRG